MAAGSQAHASLGKGPFYPLRYRANQGFESGTGERLVRDGIRVVLVTEPGDLPWRPSFGVFTRQRLHQNFDETARARLTHDIQDALSRWEPRLRLLGVETSREGSTVTARVAWGLRGRVGAELAPETTAVRI